MRRYSSLPAIVRSLSVPLYWPSCRAPRGKVLCAFTPGRFPFLTIPLSHVDPLNFPVWHPLTTWNTPPKQQQLLYMVLLHKSLTSCSNLSWRRPTCQTRGFKAGSQTNGDATTTPPRYSPLTIVSDPEHHVRPRPPCTFIIFGAHLLFFVLSLSPCLQMCTVVSQRYLQYSFNTTVLSILLAVSAEGKQ